MNKATTDSGGSTFLLTWNPEDSDLDFDKAWEDGQFQWSTGVRVGGINIGDRLFVHKQGDEPRGIVLAGYALSEVYQGRNWRRGKKKPANFVDVEPEEMVSPEHPLSIDVLKPANIVKNWDRLQGSGIHVPDPGAQRLEELWRAHFDALKAEEQDKEPGSVAETPEDIEYAIDNLRVEIERRQRQSLFRKRVLANFGHRCCISGVSEESLLNASHIMPWSAGREHRLDPANGLCLSVLYDRMFDRGFLSFSDDLSILVPADLTKYSRPTREVLASLKGRRASSPMNTPIGTKFLKYHRENVFES